MAYALTDSAVYTIAAPERLLASKDAVDFLFEGKRWVKAAELHAAAQAAGQLVPIMFADSRDGSRLIAWSVLQDVQVGDKGTHYKIGTLHQVPRSRPQDLAVLTTGRRIASGFIRPYVLCRTPRFILAEASSPRPWRGAARAAETAHEGRQYLALHVKRERNRGLVQRLKELRLKQHAGHLPCDVCAFDFLLAYGAIGEGFAEAHHCVPLSAAPSAGRAAELADLALVCSNCHSMLHRGPDFLSVGELRDRVGKHMPRDRAAG